uniref:HIRAN domain-containing protein n=1 Tax=Tetradesmus obliquus TaxID=3088 RepID=A0A383VP87_TETOB|eukprot:jgi/Sobl393_1/14624/SZX67335.1
MLCRTRLASQLCVLHNIAHWSQTLAAAAGGGAAAAAGASAAAALTLLTPPAVEMLSLKCIASAAAPSSTFDSSQVSRAVAARRQLLQRCPLQLYRLRGVTFEGRQDVIRQLLPGQPLLFQQEPSNPADPAAVHVTTLDGASVGYVAAHLTYAFTLPACSGADDVLC